MTFASPPIELVYMRNLRGQVIAQKWCDGGAVGCSSYKQIGNDSQTGNPIFGPDFDRVLARIKVADEDAGMSIDELKAKYPLPGVPSAA